MKAIREVKWLRNGSIIEYGKFNHKFNIFP